MNKNIKIWHLILGTITLFYVMPLLFIVLSTFFNSPFLNQWHTVTFSGIFDILKNVQLLDSLFNSIFIGIFSALLGIILSAFYLNIVSSTLDKENKWHINVMSFPVFFPDILWGLSLLIVSRILSVYTGYFFVILVHITFNTFLSYLILRDIFIHFPKSQLLSAKLFGMKKTEIFFKIIYPANKMTFLGCFFLCFLYSFDDFLLTFLLGGAEVNTLPLFLYSKLKYGASIEIVSIAGMTTLLNIFIFFLILKFSKSAFNQHIVSNK